MIKILSIALSAMIVLLVSLFTDPDSKVSLAAVVPAGLVPGDDCVVKVTLNRGNETGFAQVQQILPLGLKARPIETSGAKFEMQDNVISFIWKELPIEESITLSYSIQTDPNETVSATVVGAFIYMKSEQAVAVEMEPAIINFSSATTTSANSRSVQRKIIAVTPESGQYSVEVIINKKDGENTARFTDNIPDGYTITNINSGNAKFMFNNSQATFIWEPLPAEKTFKISYTLEATGNNIGNPIVNGMLVYGAEGETQTSISTLETEPAPQPTAHITQQPATQLSPPPTEQASLQTTPPATVPDLIESNLVAEANEKSSSGNFITPVPTANKDIFFKIQIAATRKSPVRNDHFFESKYHFGQHVDITENEGWRKYMLGNFDSFSSANDFSQRLREKIPDAFVVAYRNGERIPVTEAVAGMVKAN
jgi:hypothetical protein